MSSKSKGAEFERRTKKRLEELGFYVIRQRQPSFKFRACAQFPDLIALPPLNNPERLTEPLFIECKVNKYLSKDEKQKFRDIHSKFGGCFVAWPVKHKNRVNIIIGKYKDYTPVTSLGPHDLFELF